MNKDEWRSVGPTQELVKTIKEAVEEQKERFANGKFQGSSFDETIHNLAFAEGAVCAFQQILEFIRGEVEWVVK